MNSDKANRARAGQHRPRRAALEPGALAAQVCAYLAKHGWAEVASREDWTRWAPPPGPAWAGSFNVMVHTGIAPGDPEWKWIVERLAIYQERETLQIAAELVEQDQDPPEVQVVPRGYRWTRLPGTSVEILTEGPVRLCVRIRRGRR